MPASSAAAPLLPPGLACPGLPQLLLVLVKDIPPLLVLAMDWERDLR